MDLELEIRVDKWEVAMKELEAGGIDLLPMMAHTAERDLIFDFSVPHTIAYDTIFLEKGKTAEQYQTILQSSSDGFWRVGKDGRLLDVNERYVQMSGYSREELIGMHVMAAKVREVLDGK